MKEEIEIYITLDNEHYHVGDFVTSDYGMPLFTTKNYSDAVQFIIDKNLGPYKFIGNDNPEKKYIFKRFEVWLDTLIEYYSSSYEEKHSKSKVSFCMSINKFFDENGLNTIVTDDANTIMLFSISPSNLRHINLCRANNGSQPITLLSDYIIEVNNKGFKILKNRIGNNWKLMDSIIRRYR